MNACCLSESLVRHSAPTLAGIKTGNLFSVAHRFDQSLKNAIAQFNLRVKHKNIRLIPIKRQKNRTLLYIYRPKLLEQDLRQESCRCFLSHLGYPIGKCAACIREYILRLAASPDFLHEIGFFLGYPPEDVIAFMEQGPKKAKYTATWLAYTDIPGAKRINKAFNTCRRIYYTNWQNGKSIDSLTVAI